MTPARARAKKRKRSSAARGVAALIAVALCLAPRDALAQDTADPWLGPDKALHGAAGAGLAGVGYGVGRLSFEDRWVGVVFGAFAGLGGSAVKEGLDAAGAGTPSARDFLWGHLGAMVGVGVALALDYVAAPAITPVCRLR